MTATPKLGKPPRIGKVARLEPTQMEAYYLVCLHKFAAAEGRPPVLRELSVWLGRSTTTIYVALCSLERKGLVKRNGQRRFEAV